jgi:3-oxoacyl-[acyl-carrier protein] reductase
MPRTTLVTGVSRRRGTGFAIAQRLLGDHGARVFVHSYAAYDATQPWGADPGGITAVLTALGGEDDRLAHAEADLADSSAPDWLVSQAIKRLGALDALVVNHARSQQGTIAELDANILDLTWAINVRASLLLVRAFAEQYQPHPQGGRIVFFTSGQHRGPAPTEIPYAATKGALHQITATLADALAERDITVNCINPGPTDTVGPPQNKNPSSPATCPAAGGTPQPRRLTSSRCCSHRTPRPSPARSSTPRVDSGASHPDSIANPRPNQPTAGRTTRWPAQGAQHIVVFSLETTGRPDRRAPRSAPWWVPPRRRRREAP